MDLRFAFRAYQAGYAFRRCGGAVAYHHDYTVQSREAAAARMYKISALAPTTFAQVPGLQPHVAMFLDKGPVDWHEDSPGLIAKKTARRMISSPIILKPLEAVADFLESNYPNPKLLRPLYRWILGAYIFQGYRDGLRGLSELDVNITNELPSDADA